MQVNLPPQDNLDEYAITPVHHLVVQQGSVTNLMHQSKLVPVSGKVLRAAEALFPMLYDECPAEGYYQLFEFFDDTLPCDAIGLLMANGYKLTVLPELCAWHQFCRKRIDLFQQRLRLPFPVLAFGRPSRPIDEGGERVVPCIMVRTNHQYCLGLQYFRPNQPLENESLMYYVLGRLKSGAPQVN